MMPRVTGFNTNTEHHATAQSPNAFKMKRLDSRVSSDSGGNNPPRESSLSKVSDGSKTNNRRSGLGHKKNNSRNMHKDAISQTQSPMGAPKRRSILNETMSPTSPVRMQNVGSKNSLHSNTSSSKLFKTHQ